MRANHQRQEHTGSYYAATVNEVTDYPVLEGHVQADICVLIKSCFHQSRFSDSCQCNVRPEAFLVKVNSVFIQEFSRGLVNLLQWFDRLTG